MRTTSVFATATSTIHADLIVVGLKRVGISTEVISVLYPSYSQPDTVLYWLDGASRRVLSPTGETVTISGPLRFIMDAQQHETELPFLVQSLRALGLTQEQSAGFEAALLEDRVIIAVEAMDEAELGVIFHILHHIGADKIAMAETEKLSATARGSRDDTRFASAGRAPAFSLSAA
jgi:hypothetical protein